ncbi:MAG: glutamine phosphoribosylpyrophosphate amidotransferase [Candidatus Peribacteria bacterium]|nr:glutamine phosphoribosylpyrophosphate amidotransferase [Candidatus Peribacteria bacterium]
MCGIAAAIDLDGRTDTTLLAAELLKRLDHRGGVGTGMARKTADGLVTYKEEKKAQQYFQEARIKGMAKKFSSAVIGHTRYATNGGTDYTMLHPRLFRRKELFDDHFALAFNGNIPDYEEAQRELTESGHPPRQKGDTEIIGRKLLAALQQKAKSNMTDVFTSLSSLDGVFNTIMLMEDGTVHALRDKQGRHPLVYAQKDSLVLISSETRPIEELWPGTNMYDIEPGSRLEAKAGKDLHMEKVWEPNPKHCFFEWPYFADGLSVIDGSSVEQSRIHSGKILAGMDAGSVYADRVVGVPKSALKAAAGYSAESGIPLVEGIENHPDAGRTFIDPVDRERKAELKYIPVPELLRGKDIILIDDSLVRGLTMKKLIKKLRDAGAQRIHVRLASPAIVSPCFDGIDFSTVDELLVRKHYHGKLGVDVLPPDALAAIAEEIGADSVKYVPISSVPLTIQKDVNSLCMACITGKYCTKTGQKLAAKAEENALVQINLKNTKVIQ